MCFMSYLKQTFKIKNMETKKEIRLSSKWTNFNIYTELAISLLVDYFFFFEFEQFEFEQNEFEKAIIGLLCLAFTAFSIYKLIYACEAWVINDKLVLKKQFRPSKSYSFEKIRNLRSFFTGNARCTSVKMENDDKIQEKYWINNKDNFWVSEKNDPEQILISLRDTAKEDQLNDQQ